MAQTAQKNIRFTSEQWKRVEKEAQRRGISQSRLMISAALKAIQAQKWPRMKVEIHLLQSAKFAVQTIIRDME